CNQYQNIIHPIRKYPSSSTQSTTRDSYRREKRIQDERTTGTQQRQVPTNQCCKETNIHALLLGCGKRFFEGINKYFVRLCSDNGCLVHDEGRSGLCSNALTELLVFSNDVSSFFGAEVSFKLSDI